MLHRQFILTAKYFGRDEECRQYRQKKRSSPGDEVIVFGD